MKNKIVFFDDEEGRAQRWAANLLKTLPTVGVRFDVQHMTMVAFREAIDVLNERRRRARDKTKGAVSIPNHDWDETAILIIDFDLLAFHPAVTGESVAYLARCYSRCGLIVALNQFIRRPYFDLTLRGHPGSWADLNLYESQIYNPGLWAEPWKGFRPWSWPLLPQALVDHERRIEEVKSVLDQPILSFLGFDRIAQLLPRSTMEFIEGKGRMAEETTFRQFVHGSQHGLQARDEVWDDESAARIAAARIHKWLERLVLSGQDVLVDAPHLVSRFPSLLTGNPLLKRTWKGTTTFGSSLAKVLRTSLIQEFRFSKRSWVSRPCWFWGALSDDERITEVRDPWKTTDKADLVFCEDVSAFVDREEAKEFTADVPSPFVRRYVQHPESEVDYQPLVRFAV